MKKYYFRNPVNSNKVTNTGFGGTENDGFQKNLENYEKFLELRELEEMRLVFFI